MHAHQYPITINQNIKVVAETEFGGYLVTYNDNEGSVGLIWLPDELDNPCEKGCLGYNAIECVKQYFRNLMIQK